MPATMELTRRFRSTQAFAVEPRAVEAANASLPSRKHRARIFDPARACVSLFGGGDPVDPIPARIGRDVRPQRPRLRGGGELSGIADTITRADSSAAAILV